MDEMTKQLTEALAQVAKEKVRADAAEAALKAEKAGAADLAAKLTDERVRADNASRDLAKVRADAALELEAAKGEAAKVRADAATALESELQSRVKVLATAAQILGATDADGKLVDRSAIAPRALKLEVIKHVDGVDVEIDPKEDAKLVDKYVDGMFNGCVNRATSAAGSVATIRQAIAGVRADAAAAPALTVGQSAEQAARDKYNADQADAWTKEKV